MIFGDWVIAKTRDPNWHDAAAQLINDIDPEADVAGLDVEQCQRILALHICGHGESFDERECCDSCANLSALVSEWEDPEEAWAVVRRSTALHPDIPSGPGVYFLADGDTLLKVGVAEDVRTRFRTHRSSNLRLHMLAVVAGGRGVEETVHQRLASVRVAEEREWFRRDHAMLSEVLAEFETRGQLIWRRGC